MKRGRVRVVIEIDRNVGIVRVVEDALKLLFCRALLVERVPLRIQPTVLRAQVVMGRDLLLRTMAFQACFVSAGAVCFFATILRSMTDTFGVGTRMETPSSLPMSSGRTRPIAFAAPVDVGIIDIAAARPR